MRTGFTPSIPYSRQTLPRFGAFGLAATPRGVTDYLKRRHNQDYDFPKEHLDARQLRGLRLLDIGCGAGRFVYDLRQGVDIAKNHLVPHLSLLDWYDLSISEDIGFVEGLKVGGINITGIDPEVTDEMAQTGWFVQGDARNMTMFADHSFDMIYSAWSMFSFPDHPADQFHLSTSRFQFQLAALKEMQRVLKPGGRIRLGAITPDQSRIPALVAQCPGLRIISPLPYREKGKGINHVEIVKD